jgi:hypothetical protein
LLNHTVIGISVFADLRYGVGAAPANGAALQGSVIGGQVGATIPAAGGYSPFGTGGVISGLTLGTQIWLDISQAVSPATATGKLLNAAIAAFELP